MNDTHNHTTLVTDAVRAVELGCHVLLEDKLRLLGKTIATLCITLMAFYTASEATYMGMFISMIWVFDLREFVEAWYLVRESNGDTEYFQD